MSLDTSDPKLSLHADRDKIEETPIKVAWLKQQKADEEGTLPLLDFDEQQYFTFDRRRTTFRMVKHSCSYPAPPHKVRMWCSSLGASPNLPSTMDLNTFINTFELITEEKHTLEMAHLTGGETIAFEMVQEQASELSTFLLGAQPPNTHLSLKPPAAALRPSVPRPSDEDPALSGSSLEPPGTAPLENLSEQKKAAEAHRRKLADELVKEEEEEARRREKAKAKKRAKKEKQKEKKKAKDVGDEGTSKAAREYTEGGWLRAGDATVGDDDDHDDDDDDDDDDDPPVFVPVARGSPGQGSSNDPIAPPVRDEAKCTYWDGRGGWGWLSSVQHGGKLYVKNKALCADCGHELRRGDRVSYALGSNLKGPCAVDVKLVARAPALPAVLGMRNHRAASVRV